jgi:hypothetical protein
LKAYLTASPAIGGLAWSSADATLGIKEFLRFVVRVQTPALRAPAHAHQRLRIYIYICMCTCTCTCTCTWVGADTEGHVQRQGRHPVLPERPH